MTPRTTPRPHRLPLDPEDGGGRFPGFDVQSQSRHWDRATQAAVGVRLGMLPAIRFFTPAEEACADALFDMLLAQHEDPRVPVTQMVDSRLAEQETDGWHYASMPTDGEAWRVSLAALDGDAQAAHGRPFAECSREEQYALLQSIHERGTDYWQGMVAGQVWSLWTRYGCTAFYSHPWAWNEIGFAGPAYPRGYKNLGLDRREPFEVKDARPGDDPIEGLSAVRRTGHGIGGGS